MRVTLTVKEQLKSLLILAVPSVLFLFNYCVCFELCIGEFMGYKRGESILATVIILLITGFGFLLFDRLGYDTNSYFWCFVLGFWIAFNALALIILVNVLPDWLERKLGRERYDIVSFICAVASVLIIIICCVVSVGLSV